MDTIDNSELTFDDMAAQAGVDASIETESSESEHTETEGTESAQSAGTQGTEAQYQPNFKFKVKDKELEFDDLYRGVVTNADAEKKVREWHEKYHGFDEIKASRDTVKGEFEKYRSSIDPILQRLQIADLHFKNNDVEGLLNALEIPESVLAEHFERKAAVSRLSPEAQFEYNRQQNESREANFYRKQYEALQAENYQKQIDNIRNSKSMEMDQAINDPAVSSIAKGFDAQFGEGAFKEELRQRGQMQWEQTKKDVPAKLIAEQMAARYGHFAQTQVPPAANNQVPLKKSAPVIPAAQSTGKSAVKKSFTSFDEMEAAYKNGEY